MPIHVVTPGTVWPGAIFDVRFLKNPSNNAVTIEYKTQKPLPNLNPNPRCNLLVYFDEMRHKLNF